MGANCSVRVSNDTQVAILALYNSLGSWRAVGARLGVSPTMAWQVAMKGYEPKDLEIRKKFGFPEVIRQEVHRNAGGRFMRKGD